jgi:hypothetical protein
MPVLFSSGRCALHCSLVQARYSPYLPQRMTIGEPHFSHTSSEGLSGGTGSPLRVTLTIVLHSG